MQPYEDPILKKYVELIKAGVPELKSFYYGDPIRVPKSNLPTLIISKTNTTSKIK